MIEIPLSRITALYGGSVNAQPAAVEVVTDPRPWAYSAEAEFELPEIREKSQVIKLKIGVEDGRLGIGWLRQDGADWTAHVVAPAAGTREVHLSIPAGTVGGKLVFNNENADVRPSRAVIERIDVIPPPDEHYLAALAAEERGDTEAAIECYKTALRIDPTYVAAIAGLGRLRYVKPAQPVVDEIRRWLPADAVSEVVIEIRNPCNYRCFYCILAGHNNTPVQRFDLERIEQVYSQIRARMIVTSLECGGGEPTVHPQFPELIRIVSKYGYVSFPTNNSQNPKRWLPLETAKRITARSAVHPEAEDDLDKYCENARYLIDAGCDFVSLFIAHPTRVAKIPQYREYFREKNVPFAPIPFSGVHEGKRYPYSYTEEEKQLIGLGAPTTHWVSRIDPHVTRIRNFRGIPCTAGHRSIYIKNEGTVLRCMFDQERVLDRLLDKPEDCGVNNCGCSLRLEKLNQMDLEADYWMRSFGPRIDLDDAAYDWIAPMQQSVERLILENGYGGISDALSIEAMRIYDALMAAYGKDEFPE